MTLPLKAQESLPQDRRDSPRHHLVYRAAKLIDREREVFCLVRNISRRGISVRTFAPIELPADLEIALANGDALPIIKVWQRQDVSAFRFLRDVAVAEFLNASARYPVKRGLRLGATTEVVLKAGLVEIAANITNISVHGARLAIAAGLLPHEEIDLAIPGLTRRKAVVRWVKPGMAGVNFREPIPFAELGEWSALHYARGR